jgi:peptidoglycan hydrolase-like protein with peptidoglycan-binding domain
LNQRYRFVAIILALCFMVPGLAQAKSKKPAKSSAKSAKRSGKTHTARKHTTHKARGQQAMDTERVREIQAALIREHYLDGDANGVWDQRSKVAMQKFQADQGWQSKVVPDSRALIRLGLGPDHAGLLNPQTAAIETVPGGGASRGNSPLQEQ